MERRFRRFYTFDVINYADNLLKNDEVSQYGGRKNVKRNGNRTF